MKAWQTTELISPTITVKQARKILGDDAEGMSDTEIEEMIDEMFALAKVYIQSVQKS